jgi:hypothetical protein
VNKYYKILGVAPDQPIEQVKKAYREKVKTLHPDVNKAANAHEKFLELQEAFNRIIKQDQSQQKKTNRRHYRSGYKNYSKASFDSFYYRQNTHRTKQPSPGNIRKMPAVLYWFFHALFFIVGIVIMVNTIISFISFLVPQHISSFEYIAMLVFTLIFGIILTGVSVLSVIYFGLPRKTN